MGDQNGLKKLGEEFCAAVTAKTNNKYTDIQERLHNLMTLIENKKDSSNITKELDLIEKALKEKKESGPKIMKCAKNIREFWDVNKGQRKGTTEKRKNQETKQKAAQSVPDLNLKGKAITQTKETSKSDAVDIVTNFVEQLLSALHDLLKNNITDASKANLPSLPTASDKELEKKLKDMHAKVEETTKLCMDKNRDVELASRLFADLRELAKAASTDSGNDSDDRSNDRSAEIDKKGVLGTGDGDAIVPSRIDRSPKFQLDFELVKTVLIRKKDIQRLIPAVKEKKYQQYESADRKKLEDEVNSLRMRLSELAGAKLYKDNPNIVDLSDPNRPTKLKDNYCEIYSNEWMDAYQKLSESKSKRSEANIIQFLLDILLEGFAYCTQIRDIQRAGLLAVILYPMEDYGKTQVKTESVEINDVLARHLAEVLKVSGNMTGEHVAKAFFCKKDVREKFGPDIETNETYIIQCVKLCWLMQIQTPPVCIDLAAKPGDKFDNEKYKEYTKKGKKIDFIVWPPLRRNEGGDLIEKGVAQGK